MEDFFNSFVHIEIYSSYSIIYFQELCHIDLLNLLIKLQYWF